MDGPKWDFVKTYEFKMEELQWKELLAKYTQPTSGFRYCCQFLFNKKRLAIFDIMAFQSKTVRNCVTSFMDDPQT